MAKIWLYLKVTLAAVVALLGVWFALKRDGDRAALERRKRELERRRGVYNDSDVETEAAETELARKLREIDEKLESKPDSPSDPDAAAVRLRDIMGWGTN